jgi:multidrug efflux pump subunit AcrA (membrane-fusion protein)
VIEMDPEAVSRLIVDKLDDSAFKAPRVSGSFTIAGGVLRSPNLAIEGETARLFGSTTLRLADLSLGGGFVMSPTKPAGPDGMLTEANARIAANFAGTLPAPERSFDVAGVVDAIMIQALELELARLEQIRAEDETRRKGAAEERARIAAEEAARREAEQEARRSAEEAAAAEAAQAAEAARQEQPIVLQPGFNLQPPANFF